MPGSIKLRGGHKTADRRLDRIPSATTRHFELFPLTAGTMPPVPADIVWGVNWYREFDSPQQDSKGHWWIARDGKLTTVRGGHCIFGPRKPQRPEPLTWWDFYNQGVEGACAGEGTSRAASNIHRVRFDPYWLYHEAQKVDEWPGENYEGTSVRAALEVLRTQGHRRVTRAVNGKGDAQTQIVKESEPQVSYGISSYRWAMSTDDALAANGRAGLDYFEWENSWGRGYPRKVRIPATVADRLRQEDGEVGIVFA